MKEQYNSRDINLLLAGLFFLLLLFNVFTVTKLPIRETAFATMDWTYYIALFLLGYFLAKGMHLVKSTKQFHLGILLFAIMYILIDILNGKTSENELLIQVLLTLIFILGIAHIPWKREHFKLFAYISAILSILYFFHWLIEGLPVYKFEGLIRNPNITGIFLSCLLFFPLAVFSKVTLKGKLLLGIGIACTILLTYAATSRGVLLVLLTVAGARIVLILSRKLYSSLFYLVMAFNAVFLLVYGLLANSSYFTALNDWSLEYFGKSFFSGREDIWIPALKYGLEEPFLGHWIGVSPGDYMEGTHYVHAHNQYLQIFLESGFLGLASFVILLFGIWKVYQKGLDSSIVSWSSCFFLGFLVYQNVEISLFFNMEAVGLLQWVIIGTGISGVMYGGGKQDSRVSRLS